MEREGVVGATNTLMAELAQDWSRPRRWGNCLAPFPGSLAENRLMRQPPNQTLPDQAAILVLRGITPLGGPAVSWVVGFQGNTNRSAWRLILRRRRWWCSAVSIRSP